jgi:hypothetical protein
MADPRIASIVDRSGDPSTVAWAHEGAGSLAALADPELAILAAEALGNINALQSVQQPKALRKSAAAALHRLKSRGVRVESARAPASFTLASEVVDIPPRAFLSVPNARGNHHLVLTATDREGSCIMDLILGGGKVQDEHGHASRSQLREFWKELENDPTTREIPFAAGLHMGDRAASGRRLHGWDHLLEKVSPATLSAARALDPGLYVRPDSGQALATSPLPLSLVPSRLIERALEAVNTPREAEAEAGEHLFPFLDELADSARGALADAAREQALVYRLTGFGSSAEKADALAESLAAGVAGHGLAELRQTLLIAMFEELQRAQSEEEADRDAWMRMVGQQ